MNKDRNRRIYESEFRDWLPPDVLDCHIHLCPRNAFPADWKPGPRSWMGLYDDGYTLDLCRADAVDLLPGQRFNGLCFGAPDAAVNRAVANEYVAASCDNRAMFGLALVAPDDRADDLERWFRNGRLLGYKPYHSYVRGKPASQVGVHDMLPAAQMELADGLGLVIMLHVSRPLRLADPDNQREVCELADRYPRANIVLAHIGRAYYLSSVVGHLERIRERPNVYVDLAMLNHWEVLEYLFRRFPRERILFGTDMPVSCLGGKSVEINDQYAYVVERDLRIGSMIWDAEGVIEFTTFYYEELRAIRKAAERVGLTRQEIEGVFFRNAMTLLNGVARRLTAAPRNAANLDTPPQP